VLWDQSDRLNVVSTLCPLAGTSSNSVTNPLSQYEQKIYGQTRGGTGGTEFLKGLLEQDEKRASNTKRLFHEYSGIHSFPRHVREERMRARVRENVRERVTPTHAGIFDTTRVLRPKCGFSKVLYIVTLYTKYTRALTFENLSKVIAVL
jgi:hypothetical protein